MRFHILGLPHAKTHKEYSADAFAQKVRLICKMLNEAGHEVFHYGPEGSNPICTHNINVLPYNIFNEVHNYDWKKCGFKTGNDNIAAQVFIENCITEINKVKRFDDILLCSFGIQHKPIADAVGLKLVVELGIGYEGSFAPFRIFESYAWMHYVYGQENRSVNPTPNMYDNVIPNYYDLDDYIYSNKKDDYYFFIARPTILKGLEVAIKTVEHIDGKLIVAGQGEPPFTSKNMEFIGVVSIEERAKLMSKAKSTFVPTLYTEPFGGVVIESLLSGTPVITTDFGAFTETVPHGEVGYRCRTLAEFIWAANNIQNINCIDCRKWGEKYSLENVYKKYIHYFNNLQILLTNEHGWYAI